MKKIIIAIDGYSSCGKSTLANQLAKKLNYIFIDSGAMYRAVTLYFLRNHIDWNKSNEVKKALPEIHLDFEFDEETNQSSVLLNGENVAALIRDMLVSENVSAVSTIKEVREFAVAQQQQMGKKKGIVMDGRDIGTTVFPNAALKIFVTADIAVRVERRFKEMLEKKIIATIEEVQNNLEMRDYIDSNREFSPLRKADDARILDNSMLTRDEQLDLALRWAKEKIEL
jgi:cytidylate kinase